MNRTGIIINCIITVFCLLLLASCRENEVVIDSKEKELFLKSQDDGIYKNGIGIMLFDDSMHQKSYNMKRKTFRIQTDNQDEYFNVFFESMPKNKGVKILSDYVYYSNEEKVSSSILLECSQIEGDRVWFWEPDEKIGIIISY